MNMQSLRKALATLMSVVFILMSSCLVVQAVAAEHSQPSCHSKQNQNDSPRKFEMERCCQNGVLKSAQKFTSDLQTVDILPLYGSSEQALFLFRLAQEREMFFHTPPAGRRLAELSLLRI